MFKITVNMIFATVFVSLAWWSMPRGWNFIRMSWTALQANPEKQANRSNTELYFFLAGLAWFIGGISSALVAAVLVILTIIYLLNS
jgi:hypothetical protein